MLFSKSIKKVLSDRGYQHAAKDDMLSLHGEYARNIQYAFSKEFSGQAGRVIDLVFLSADMRDERVVVGFFRENVTVESGVMMNITTSIPLLKFSLDALEKELDRIIPAGDPAKKGDVQGL